MNLALIEELAGFSNDPLGFVLFAFPWGEPGELSRFTGPEQWQIDILEDVRKGLLTFDQAVRVARTSGHGIGKSALVSWLILWGMGTMEDTIGVVTANTETQLKTKTWVQLAKWFRLFIGRELFEMTATKLCSIDPEHANTWRFDMVPWSERNTEAFAGLHNQGKRIILLFDEASAIPDMIWEVAEGALTDENTQIIWAAFGNPTRSTGRFRDCFEGGKFSHRWKSAAIDSRTVSFTNKAQFDEWVQDYGEDSDFVRVRVRGVFPRTDASSFISYELASEAVGRTVEPQYDPIIIGVDVARFGGDSSVLFPRKGRDASSIAPRVLYGLDTMQIASRVAEMFVQINASLVFVDGGGVGGGVVDRLRQLRIPVIDVDFGGKPEGGNPNDGTKYANRRAEMWGRLRDWLKTGSLPSKVSGLVDTSLVGELTGPLYTMTGKDEIKLERKEDMKSRGLPSPNAADALALTFAAVAIGPVRAIDAFNEKESAYTPDFNPQDMEHLYS